MANHQCTTGGIHIGSRVVATEGNASGSLFKIMKNIKYSGMLGNRAEMHWMHRCLVHPPTSQGKKDGIPVPALKFMTLFKLVTEPSKTLKGTVRRDLRGVRSGINR